MFKETLQLISDLADARSKATYNEVYRQEQLHIQSLAQGHFNMWSAGATVAKSLVTIKVEPWLSFHSLHDSVWNF